MARSVVPLAEIGDPHTFTDLVMRSAVPPGDIAPAVRRAVGDLDPRLGADVRAFASTIRDGRLRERLMAALSGFFGVLAALIAAVGLYGVLSYSVTRRTNEIGVRLALGARRGDILAMILRQAGSLVAAGLAAGPVLAVAAAGAARSLLFGLQPHDLAPVALACGLLSVVALAAAFLPARRAAALEPLAALRATNRRVPRPRLSRFARRPRRFHTGVTPSPARRTSEPGEAAAPPCPVGGDMRRELTEITTTSVPIPLVVGAQRWDLFVFGVIRVATESFVQVAAVGPQVCTATVRVDARQGRAAAARDVLALVREWLAGTDLEEHAFLERMCERLAS